MFLWPSMTELVDEDAIGGRAMIVYKDIKITVALASQIG